MAIRKVLIHAIEVTCERCGHTFMPRPRPLADGSGGYVTPEPITCANKDCKSAMWRTPRKTGKTKPKLKAKAKGAGR